MSLHELLDNTYTFNELPEVQFPSNFDITHALTFGTSYNYKNLKVALGLNWRTGRPTTLPVEGIEVVNNEVNYEDVNTNNLDDYIRADFSAIYQLKTNKRWRADIGFSIWNLTNNTNTIEQFFRVDTAGELQSFNNQALETTFNTVFRLYY